MTLAEKIAALRGARELSQGDLAEALDVSRQSVSKWETGQSVPELDKIIKLADLFGITVDELVRDGDVPAVDASKPEASPAAQPETKIVYVERPRRLTRAQILGIICIVSGLVLWGLFGYDPELPILGVALIVASLPLLLVKKHPYLVSGWLIWAVGYPIMCNPAITGLHWQPFTGVWGWCPLRDADSLLWPLLWLLWLGALALSALTVVLPVYTGWLCWKRWKKWSVERQEQQTA